MRARIAVLLLAFIGALALGSGSAWAAPGVVQDLPGCRANNLPRNDDGSTGAVPIGFTANVFDLEFDQLFVNNNGNVTFDQRLGTFTPFDFRETGQAMIAPFFADVDTTGTGSGIVHYGTTTLGGAQAFCVIWDNVGYFSSNFDKRNKFQLLIVNRPGQGIDVIFNYDTITWETGEASGGEAGFGGTSAAAGYSAGDGDSAHALMLPGSFVNGGLLDSNAATSLAGHATTGQPAGRYVFPLRQGAITGGRLIGDVTTSGGGFATQAPVQMCRTGGACTTRLTNSNGHYVASNLTPGTYTVTAFPGQGSNDRSVTVTGVAVGGPGTERTQNLQLLDPPAPPPDGTEISNIGETGSGVPIAYWGDPLQLSTEGCPNATSATYRVLVHGRQIRNGTLTESPAGSGVYRATIAPLIPNSGDGEIIIDLNCPSTPDEQVDFGIYIDPSGLIRDTLGRPIEDATVTLTRSAAAQGPFFPVPDGSAIMSPSNRENPMQSREDGRFGWDVVAGFYVVTAEKDGCVSAADPSRPDAVSRVMTIPPPVTDLDLRLNCGETPIGGTPAPPPGPVVVTPPPPAVISGPRQLVAVRSAKFVRGGRLAVKVRCAPTAVTACSGKVAAKIRKKAAGSKRFSKLKPGKTVTVRIKLNKKGRAAVRRTKKGKKVKIALTVTIRDASGVGETARRTLRVRR